MPSICSSRRNVLVGCAALGSGLLSGCTSRLFSGDTSPDSTSATGPRLHLRLASIGQSLVDHHVVDLTETRIEWDEKAFQAALEGSDFTLQYRHPFPVGDGDEPAYARHDGTYYRLDAVIVGEAEVTHPVLRLYRVGRQGDADDLPEFTPTDELPKVDQTAVHIAHMAARARGNRGGMPVGLVQRGGYVYRSAERADESRLLAESGPQHVSYRDVVYRIELSNETFYEPIYRPDVDPVAESTDEMEAVLRAVFVDSRIDPESRTQDERRIIREARGDGYAESHPFSDSFESILTALDKRAYLDGNIEKDAGVSMNGREVLQYGDEYYDYHLRFES